MRARVFETGSLLWPHWLVVAIPADRQRDGPLLANCWHDEHVDHNIFIGELVHRLLVIHTPVLFFPFRPAQERHESSLGWARAKSRRLGTHRAVNTFCPERPSESTSQISTPTGTR